MDPTVEWRPADVELDLSVSCGRKQGAHNPFRIGEVRAAEAVTRPRARRARLDSPS